MEFASCRYLGELEMSGCLRVPGGKKWQAVVEYPTVLVSTGLMLCGIAALPLRIFSIIPREYFYPMLLIGLVGSMLLRWFKSLLLGVYIGGRQGALKREFPHLKSKPVGLEDGETHQKIKVVTEDEGFCLLDPDNHRILIDGCAYRHLIWAKDVKKVSPVSGYGLSGAMVECILGGQELKLVLATAGQGPVASLVQAFAPGAGAADLARIINKTLFDVMETTHIAPPPVDSAAEEGAHREG